MSDLNLIWPLLLGMASGFIGGIATGGGLLSIPGLMFLGLPANVAIATNNLTAASSLSSAYRYRQANLFRSEKIRPFLVLSIIGSVIGSKLLLQIDAQLMQRLSGVACLALGILFSFSKPLSRPRNRTLDLLGLLAILLSSVFAGLFGTGGGFFMVYILGYFYGLGIIEANASTKLINLGGTLAAIGVFLRAGLINFHVGLPLMIGSAIGGYVGAHTAIKKGDEKVKLIFLAIILISAIKLILG